MHTMTSKKMNNGKRNGSDQINLSQFDMTVTQVSHNSLITLNL
jgi:hypothetical protein